MTIDQVIQKDYLAIKGIDAAYKKPNNYVFIEENKHFSPEKGDLQRSSLAHS